MERTAVVLGRAELVSECMYGQRGVLLAEEVALTYLLEGGVPSKLRERCSGSYLMFAASAGSCFTKSVSSRSWISRATGALVEACRRHCRLEVCERAEFCVRRRLKNEAVTSCRAMMRVCGWIGRAGFTQVAHFAATVCDGLDGLGLSRRGSASRPIGGNRRLQPRPIIRRLSRKH